MPTQICQLNFDKKKVDQEQGGKRGGKRRKETAAEYGWKKIRQINRPMTWTVKRQRNRRPLMRSAATQDGLSFSFSFRENSNDYFRQKSLLSKKKWQNRKKGHIGQSFFIPIDLNSMCRRWPLRKCRDRWLPVVRTVYFRLWKHKPGNKSSADSPQ